MSVRYMDLFPELGTTVYAGGRQYYFVPYWFELIPGSSSEILDGVNMKVMDKLEPHALGDLPQELRDVVQAIRDERGWNPGKRGDHLSDRLANPVDFGKPQLEAARKVVEKVRKLFSSQKK